jgi:hypothetical protein
MKDEDLSGIKDGGRGEKNEREERKKTEEERSLRRRYK